MSLHKENPEDEPLELDVDVSVTCKCGVTSTEREALYKEDDWVHVMCAACGASYKVEVHTVLSFSANAVEESGSVLAAGGLSARGSTRRRGPHVA